MKDFFTKIWNDSSFFILCLRSTLLFIGLAIVSGVLSIPGIEQGNLEKFLGLATAAGAIAIPYGQMNPKKDDSGGTT